MPIASKTLTIDAGLMCALVAMAVLFSPKTLAAPASTIDPARSAAKPQDDWVLVNQLLPAARAGDREAQYQLFAIIDDCQNQMNFYFTQGGTPLTLEEGLEKASKQNQEQQARAWFARCHQFQEHNVAAELGSAEYWLEKATEGGQPLAQAVTARKKLDEDLLSTLVPLGHSSGLTISIPSGAAPDRHAVDLLRAAVKSLNPRVLEIIGLEQMELHGSRNAQTVDQFAWIYAACRRGLNCSPTSRWGKDCPKDCDVSTPEGIIKGWSGEEWPAVLQRSKEINAKLDAGRWDELGL